MKNTGLASLKPSQVAPSIKTYADTTCSHIRALVSQYAGWDVDTMVAIAQAESGCHADHVNDNPRTGDYSVGVFQINLYGALAASRPSKDWLLDPSHNVQFAHELWKRSGYYPWTTYTRGIYLQYLR